MHRDLKPDEYALYNYFNKTLWSKIDNQPADFWQEVDHFKQLKKNVTKFCEDFYKLLRNNPKQFLTLISGIQFSHAVQKQVFRSLPLSHQKMVCVALAQPGRA